jgi:hypothetical protein
MKKRNLLTAIFAVTLVAFAAFPYFRTTAAAQPGEAADPLVTRRYVDEKVDALWAEIQILRQENASLRELVGAGNFPGIPSGVGDIQALANAIFPHVMINFELVYGEMLRGAPRSLFFEPLHVRAGQTIIVENGTEMILRGGNAVVVAGPNGLTNVTAGTDIAAGQPVPTNNLLISPLSDGRGLHFPTEAWIMVRGGFVLQ